MRSYRRPIVSLPTLREIEQKYQGDLINELKADGGPPEDKWGNADVRGAIYAMQGRTCAYCQREASDRRGDVEHFRPKADYRWLMYVYGNYFLSCRTCNSHRKGKRFPVEPESSRVDYARRDELGSEPRLLIDPVEDPVEDWIRINYDKAGCPIELKASAADDEQAAKRVEATRDFFYLNTNQEIVDDRMFLLDDAIQFALLVKENDDTTARATLLSLSNRYRPHGAAVRQLIEELLPEVETLSERAELEWYVNRLTRSAEIGVSTVVHLEAEERGLDGDLKKRKRKQRQDAERKLAEGLWTLAVLLHDPPGETPPDEIRAWIHDASPQITDKVVELLPELVSP